MSGALGAARRAARRVGGLCGAAGGAAQGGPAPRTPDTHAALSELLRVDGRREVQSPGVVRHGVLPVHEAFGRLPDAGACRTTTGSSVGVHRKKENNLFFFSFSS